MKLNEDQMQILEEIEIIILMDVRMNREDIIDLIDHTLAFEKLGD